LDENELGRELFKSDILQAFTDGDDKYGVCQPKFVILIIRLFGNLASSIQ
jgi:hypothetical protein